MKSEVVLKLVAKVPCGKVTTYGSIGRALGMHPRQVGRLLHINPDPVKYPCHRVVRSDGVIASGYAFGGPEAQIYKLEQEGIEIKDGKIIKFHPYQFSLPDKHF